MRPSDEIRAGVPHNGTAGISEEGATRGTGEGMLETLGRVAQEILGAVNGLIEVKADRLRLSVRQASVKVAIACAAALCAALWLGAASLSTLRGLCGGFTALWGGRVWLGELCGGAFALLLAAGVAALLLRSSTRRELARLEKKYERIRNEQSANENREDSASNSGDAARLRGSAGDTADRRSTAAPG